ncbi:hypothetical protein NDU88_004166 [Pleurodeles waltl]|uniref:Uncharacterized protein n=1 Tax=Pleurodeles waltl TaxID=8319 RepID=A0AAV7V274_PLEWA|nr:hypothetical protein NDU88_004166 [Pleurodeles waltl]
MHYAVAESMTIDEACDTGSCLVGEEASGPCRDLLCDAWVQRTRCVPLGQCQHWAASVSKKLGRTCTEMRKE